MSLEPLLDAEISVTYGNRVEAVRKARICVRQGEILGLAGESGSGKSTISLAILNLLGRRGAHASGHVMFRGRDLLRSSERELRALRGSQISLMLQNAAAALNPRLKLGTQFREVWRAHGGARGQWQSRATEMLETLGLRVEPGFFDRYPGELSIGMAQRVLLAVSVLHRPALLIADEPTSALDLITSSELMGLFRRLNQEHGMSILFISHDLLALASVCHRVAILRQGEVVETLSVEELFTCPGHPYTRRLVGALPEVPRAAGESQRAVLAG